MRRATADDAFALSLVASAVFLETYASVLDGADLVAHCRKHNTSETFAAWVTDPATIVTLAEIEPGHAPVGYSVLTKPEFPFEIRPTDIELRRIYILQQVQGVGLGAALMAQAFADATAIGHDRLLLGVWEHNHRAHVFYERQGFELIGTRQFAVGATTHEDPVYARSV
ncbi:GNAT family N-acetyltransferase [Sphingomonas sp. PB2P19]|uniref:GNAT family N-acetyltransferase n=1 Tax=Sphingomonas rhamnosi TaxID=3096156 RepID=UPI002FC91097